MKKITLICFLAFVTFVNLKAQAPSYVDFEWDVVRLGYAIPVGDDQASAGVSFGGELRYNLKDNLSIGIGTEAVLFDLKDANNDAASLGASRSIYLSGDYYLNGTSPNRGFLGVQVGYSSAGDVTIKKGTVDVDDTLEGPKGFSITPRVGYELGHVRFSAGYHLGFKEGLTDYLSFGVALTLWGGYRG